MVTDETWMTAAEALEIGFIDSIAEVGNSDETVAQKISEPTAQQDFEVGEVPTMKTNAHGEMARRLSLYERQITQ